MIDKKPLNLQVEYFKDKNQEELSKKKSKTSFLAWW